MSEISVQIVVCTLINWWMHVTCRGLGEPLDLRRFEALQRVMNDFGQDCHMTCIWAATLLGNLESNRRQLESNLEPDEWVGGDGEPTSEHHRSCVAHTYQTRRGVEGVRDSIGSNHLGIIEPTAHKLANNQLCQHR
ncbi:MAG: hypothetical protein F4180_01910 [Chloroflexi bacterium]|nr:hypothetical protein [Chloroflexota bacterium]